MKVPELIKNILHVAFPLAERILPPGQNRRLVGGLLALPVRLAPLLLGCAVYAFLIYLGEFLISEMLYRFVVLLKLPKVFRLDWLEPPFFDMLGYQFRRAGLLVLAAYAAFRALGTAFSAVYLTAREIIVIKRWPFSVSLLRIPLASVRYAALHQFPGERLLGTGRIDLAWSDREILQLPGVPRGETKLAWIMSRLGPANSAEHAREVESPTGNTAAPETIISETIAPSTVESEPIRIKDETSASRPVTNDANRQHPESGRRGRRRRRRGRGRSDAGQEPRDAPGLEVK